MKNNSEIPFSQRQLRVGELVKQNLGQIFLRNEAKIPTSDSNLITVTEVRMSTDLKSARVYLTSFNNSSLDDFLKILTKYQHLVRKALAKRLDIKYLPRLLFIEDKSFDYAERIEKIIRKNKVEKDEIKKKRYN